MDSKSLLKAVSSSELLPIAEAAGAILMKIYRDGWKIDLKSDGSPATSADLAVHDFLVTELTQRFGLPILSEEDPTESVDRKRWTEFIMIDPLDGTRDFMDRNDEFSILITYLRDNIPQSAVLYAPALSEIYHADRGQGSYYRNAEGLELRLPIQIPSPSVMLCSRHHNNAKADHFAKFYEIEDKVYLGSALKFARLASGKASVYPRFEGSKEWDISAGDLILHEAGGQIIDLTTGVPPKYNKDSLKNNWFIATSNTFPQPNINLKDFQCMD